MGLFGTKKHSIGKTIAELRKAKGWTQIELAEKLQVSDKAISKWEKDSGAPSIEFFPVLAELFGVSIDYIMTGKKPEAEIITISKAEFCAKNDDPTLLADIDPYVKDENGKTLIDYIIQYESCKVFVGFCELNKKNISYFNILDAIKLTILSNRLDLLNGATYYLGYHWAFENEKALLGFMPAAVKNKFINQNTQFCILTDELFEMIVCDNRINEQTMSILLGKQNNRECVWYHVFPYLIHQSYLHNKIDLFNNLLALAVSNNEYAYNNFELSCDRYGGYNYKLHFFFIGNEYGNVGHGLVRILEETVKLALERGDFENLEKFTDINAAIIKYHDFKPYIPSDYEIKMAKLKADKTVSKEELTIQSTIHDGLINIDELLATKDIKIIKQALDNYPIHPIEAACKLYKNKEWKKLFEYAVDNDLKTLADCVLDLEIESIGLQLVDLFFKNSDYQGYPTVNRKALIVRNVSINKHNCNVEKIVEYIQAYKYQIISDISYELDKEKTIGDLTKEYFEAELEKGNSEMVVVKLCVRLEAILRSNYHYEGDFSEMLNAYCNAYGKEDDGWGYDQEAHFVKVLQKLRKYRNSIVHSEKTSEKLSLDELRYCIDYICKMN